LRKTIAVILVMTFMTTSAFGQQNTKKKPSGPRRQLATIVFAGLGGAILGLSTLSFYGRPQEQLSNIAIGFAVGVITGTIYVTFRSATTREYYEDPNLNPDGTPKNGSIENSIKTVAQLEEPRFLWAPLVQRSAENSSTAVGLQGAITF
jgi:hypothetical protein